MTTKFSLLAVAACTFLISTQVGCNARAVSRSVDGYTPVTSLEGLKQDTSRSPEYVYQRPGVPGLSAYDHFIVGPVTIDYRDPDMQELSTETVQRIQKTLIDAVTNELLEGGYSVGTKTVPGTKRLSFVISGFSASESGNVANAAVMAAGFATGVPLGWVTINVGEVTVEGVFTDAYENRIDLVAIDRAAGARIFNGNPLSTWSDVDSAFKRWAVGIREAIDKKHSQAKP